MIDPVLLRDLYRLKYDAVRSARKQAMVKIATFGMVRKSDQDIWEDFMVGGSEGLTRMRVHMSGEEFSEYLRALTRIAGRRGGAARSYLAQARKMAGANA